MRLKNKTTRRNYDDRRAGSASANKPKIFSYSSVRNSKNRPLNRGEEKSSSRPTGSKRLSGFINILIFLFFAGSLLYLTVLEPSGQVKVSGEKIYPREKASYEARINELLRESVFYRNKLTFDEAGLAEKIKQEFPEVNSIDVSVALMRHKPLIEVTLAKPAAKLVTKDKTYILDSEGRALFEESQASESLDTGALLAINDSSDHQVSLGKPALTQTQISFINAIIGHTTAKGLNPQSFALSEGGTAVDVRFEGVGYFVKFSFYADARQSSGAFIAMHEQLSADGLMPGQYVDLRVPDKAFFR